jgi:hypothetical protein
MHARAETQARSLRLEAPRSFAALIQTPKRQGVLGAEAAAGALALLLDDADEEESPPDELLLEEDSAELLVLLDESDDEVSDFVDAAAASVPGSPSVLVELVLFL